MFETTGKQNKMRPFKVFNYTLTNAYYVQECVPSYEFFKVTNFLF